MERKALVLKRLLRVPTFRVAYLINVAALGAFVVWSFMDAGYFVLLRFLGRDYGIVSYFIRRDLGPRPEIFYTLAAIGGLSLIIVIGRLFVGRSSSRSVVAWLATIALLAVWIRAAFLSIDPHTGAEYRVARDLHRFESMVTAIEQHPGAKNIDTGWGDEIRFLHSPDFGDYVSVKRAENTWSTHETVAIGLQLNDGAYLFAVRGRPYYVEYHPDGTQPSESQLPSGRTFAKGDLITMTELGNGWFLTSYAHFNE
jgi:hypothetical protein